MSRFSKEQVAEAAKAALGRTGDSAASSDLYAMYKDFDGSLDDLKRAFAGSAEAQNRGVKGEDFGVKYVDPTALTDQDKPFYEAWQRGYGKKVRMSTDALDNWRQNGSAELLEAQAKGDVKTRMQDGKRILEVSKAAYKKYGTNLFTGLHAGEAVLVEKGAGSDLEPLTNRWRQSPRGVDQATLDKYEVWVKDAKKHSGVLGGAAKSLGLGNNVANSLDRAAGYAAVAIDLQTGGMLGDEAAAIGGGTRGAQTRNSTYVNALHTVGFSKKEAGNIVRYGDVVGDVATAVGAAVVDGMFFGVLSSANQGMEAWQKSQVGDKVEWGNVGRDIAISWAAYGVGSALQSARAAAASAGAARTATALKVAENAWRFGGSQAAVTAAQGGNRKDIAMSAGRGLVLSALPDSRAWQGGANFALTYADSKRRGMSDQDAAFQASSAAAMSAATARGSAPTWSERVASMRTGASNLQQGWRGSVPDAWTADRRGVTDSMRLAQARAVVDRAPAGWTRSLLPESRPTPLDNFYRRGAPAPVQSGYTDGRLRPRQGALL